MNAVQACLPACLSASQVAWQRCEHHMRRTCDAIVGQVQMCCTSSSQRRDNGVTVYSPSKSSNVNAILPSCAVNCLDIAMDFQSCCQSVSAASCAS